MMRHRLLLCTWCRHYRTDNITSMPLALELRLCAAPFYRPVGDEVEVFLAAVRNGDGEDRDRAREAMIKVFAVLGDQDPLTTEYRRKLSAALF